MNAEIKSLIAVGAAAAVNCRPCLEHLVPQRIQAGASGVDIREAVETGFQVNRGAQAKMRNCVDVILTYAKGADDKPKRKCRRTGAGAQNGCC
jgi:alkylhydroperoxidase/carboxymuconolactone decarboxylase family protein YurZ